MDDGLTADCKIKGNFRLRGIRSTNPIAVGDRVEVKDGFIIEIEDRRNYIIRKSINLSKQSHILAANVDQALLVVTVSKPETFWLQQRLIACLSSSFSTRRTCFLTTSYTISR